MAAPPATDPAAQKKLLELLAAGGAPSAALIAVGWMLSQDVEKVSEQVAILQSEVKALEISAAGDRWTATQHAAFERRINERLRDIEDRLRNMEQKR